MSSFPPLSTLGSAGRPRGCSVERGRGAMRARGHGGAEMAKVGCRVDARADRGACENEKRGEGKGDGERRTLCPSGVYDGRVVSDVCISGRT